MTPKKKVAAAEPERNPLVRDAEVAAATKPEGMPQPWPLHALPRRWRAEAYRRVGDLVEKFEKVGGLADDNGEVEIDLSQIGLMAEFTELVADMVDFFVSVAQPGQRDEMSTWGENADDLDVAAAFSWYMTTMRPGEAGGS